MEPRDTTPPARLTLRHELVDAGPDWPVVAVLIDGRDAFAAVAPGWHGFDPAEMLGPGSPLLPVDPGRRVALYRCTCGIAGCGVIAATITRSPDGRQISWTDFADHVGVFDDPVACGRGVGAGRPWPLPDLHFDAVQYEAEVRRLTSDTSWESPRRRTARRVQERLEDSGLLAAATGLALRWTAPAWDGEGVVLSFARSSEGSARTDQVLLHLVSRLDDPDEAAARMVDELTGVDPRDWSRSFGHGLRRRR